MRQSSYRHRDGCNIYIYIYLYTYNIYLKYFSEVYTIKIEIAGMLRFSDYFSNLDTWNIVF